MSNETRDEIKSYITRSNWKIVDIVERLKSYGIETTPQALSNKLSRDTIRYSEVKIIAEIIGYKLTWEKVESGLSSDISNLPEDVLRKANKLPAWSKGNNASYNRDYDPEKFENLLDKQTKISDLLEKITNTLNASSKIFTEEHKSTRARLITDPKEKEELFKKFRENK